MVMHLIWSRLLHYNNTTRDFDGGVSNTTNADKNADAGEHWSESGSVADTFMLIPMLMLILMPSLMVMVPNPPALMLSLCHIAHNPPPSSSSARSPPAPNQSHTPIPPPPTNGASQKLLPEARWTAPPSGDPAEKIADHGEGPGAARDQTNWLAPSYIQKERQKSDLAKNLNI